MNIIAIGQLVFSLLPVVTDAVKNAEAAFGAGNGKDKLAFVLAAVASLYNASNPPVPFDNIVKVLTEMVAHVVTYYNNTKVFLTKAKAA